MAVPIGDVLFQLFAFLVPIVLLIAVVWIVRSVWRMQRQLDRIERQLNASGERKERP